MIRFKVVKASKLLLFVALAILVGVLCAIMVRYSLMRETPKDGVNARLVQGKNDGEAETISVFASTGHGLKAPSEDKAGIEVEVLSETSEPAATLRPTVLIYHTHTHEAYEQVRDDPYEAVEAWRTTDNSHSVVRVGQELAHCLEARGFEVTHDVTDHENDTLSTAYTRSLNTLKRYEAPFDLYIDLHRDAYIKGMKLRYTDAQGNAYAQPMLLIGNGNGFDEKPFYTENLAFAKNLTERLNALMPGLCKDVLVKDGRYNQHIGVFSVLIEVGHNKNTLREALNTVPLIADGIRHVFDAPDPALEEIIESHTHH